MSLIFSVTASWLFSGWPQILNFPPEIQEARAAVSYVGAGALGAAAAAAADPTAALPASTQTNDILIIHAWTRSTADITTIAEFTEFAQVDTALGSHHWFWKRHDGSEGTATCDRTGTTGDSYCQMFAFRGVVTSGNPWNALGTPENDPDDAGTDGIYTLTGITTGAANSMVVVFTGYEDNDEVNVAMTGTDPATYTAVYDESSVGIDGAISMGYAIRTAAGGTGNITVDYGNAETSDAAGSVVLSLTPVVAPTVTTQAASSVEATTATCNGTITATGGGNATSVGCEWDIDSGAPYANNPSTAGNYGAAPFTKSLTGLPSGTTIYARAFATNVGGTGYGSETSWLTKPAAPTGVAATDGTYTDKVTITWTKSTGATDYHVWRDSTDLGSAGDVATYNDTGAGVPTITAGSAGASDGTTNYVELSLSGASANNGTTHTYKVVASNATGNSVDSSTDTGYRGVGSLTYQWQRSAADSDANYSDISGATTASYNDTGAPADGSGRYYKCVLNATGATQQTSSADRGYRSVAVVSVTLDQETFAYGSVVANTASSTLTLWGGAGITATNGEILANFDIYGANSTGSGSGWTLAGNTTGNNYIHQFCNDTDNDCTSPPTNYTALAISPQTLKSNVATGGTVRFQLRITTPTTPTDLSQQNAVVTIQASAP